MKITLDQIENQVRQTKQVRFELVAIENWVNSEEPKNAANILEALQHVYATLEGTQRTLSYTRSAMEALGKPLEVPADPHRKAASIPILSLVCH